MDTTEGPRYTGMSGLLEIMERLRAPGGCPWDSKQDYGTMKRYVIEEAYELVEAMDEQDYDEMREECGDLLLQVVFVSQLATEEGRFCFDDVVSGIVAKLVSRHPHVFGNVRVSGPDEVTRNWEAIKARQREEKQTDSSAVAGVPKSMPSLQRALRLQEKAARAGFDWPEGSQEPVYGKIAEEVQEVRDAQDCDVASEIGDLLFSVVNLARRIGVEPEEALHRACGKFTSRFRSVEERFASRGLDMRIMPLAELDRCWDEVKKDEK